jgi:fatty acid/phospholipid biosynthesis enzyme
VDGIVIVCHGSSSAKAYQSALRVARRAAERDLAGRIERVLQEPPAVKVS